MLSPSTPKGGPYGPPFGMMSSLNLRGEGPVPRIRGALCDSKRSGRGVGVLGHDALPVARDLEPRVTDRVRGRGSRSCSISEDCQGSACRPAREGPGRPGRTGFESVAGATLAVVDEIRAIDLSLDQRGLSTLGQLDPRVGQCCPRSILGDAVDHRDLLAA